MTNGSNPPDRAFEEYRARCAHELVLNRATAEFERAALQPLLVLNGGAVVAFLTLLGAVLEKAEMAKAVISVGLAELVVTAWCVGLVSAALATATGYWSQRAFAQWGRLRRQAAERRLPGYQNSTTFKEGRMSDEELAEERNAFAKRLQLLAIALSALSLLLFIVGSGVALRSIVSLAL